MNGEDVRVLEGELENAIGRVVRRLAKTKKIIAPSPSKHTYRMMAKAAAAVLEAVVERDK